MKHSMILKFLAIALASVALVVAVGCTAGIVSMESAGLYVNGLDDLQDPMYDSIAKEIAKGYAELYAAENLGRLPYTLKASMYPDPTDRSDADHWYVRLTQDGVQLDEAGDIQGNVAFSKEFRVAPLYFIASLYSPEDMVPPTTTPDPGESQPADQNIDSRSSSFEEITVPDNYLYYSQETTFTGGRLVTYYLYYYQAPEYVVTVQMLEDVLDNSSIHLLRTIYPYRYTFIIVLVASLLTAAVCMVYLFIAAGQCAGGDIRPGGLNRMPIDLYLAVAAAAVTVLGKLFFRLYDWMQQEGPHPGNLSLMAVNLWGIASILIAFFFALAAQLKTKDSFLRRHSIIGWFCGKMAALLRLAGKTIAAVGQMLPMMWLWPVSAGIMAASTWVCWLLMCSNQDRYPWGIVFTLLFLVCLAVCAGIVIYCGYCFAVLMKGAKQMSDGDLGCKIPTKYLWGSFLVFATELNCLSETAMIAAQKQMQSERMKSELITNVSHDIKTPLTSIINFVDLLQKADSPQEQQEYLEVLSRQSARMKKLIEDLMELSRASSGNITVNLQQMDAVEAVKQALGEFSDKLEAAGLEPVFQQPPEPVMILADGRLSWRVISNLLTNAVKYAMPGTRLYVELVPVENVVLLSLKNVSREPLTMRSEDLLERFVRGDASRNSEGSGLGLNIAKNLMEVQGGQLNLLLDGDLFKATVVFPAAK